MYEHLIHFIRDWYETDAFIPLHQPRFTQLDKEYVLDAIESGYVSSVGRYVDRFEEDLALWVGAKRAVAVVNGTSALQVALRLIGVMPDDEVITQPLTFIATTNAISYNNAHPVFVDVSKDTLGLCPNALAAFLQRVAKADGERVRNRQTGRRIAAVVPMHTFGHPCQIQDLCDVASRWNIPVVEDSAESLGSWFRNQHTGTFGRVGVFSFNGNKTITCGGGGAIVTDDESIADRAKHMTTTAKLPHSWEYVHDQIGYNFRIPNLNAALGCAQLKLLKSYIDDKRKLADAYSKLDFTDSTKHVKEPYDCCSNYWLNTLLLPSAVHADQLLRETNSHGIMTRPVWRLMNISEPYKHCQCGPLDHAHWLAERLVNIPSSARPISIPADPGATQP